jgi:hypothetical protein
MDMADAPNENKLVELEPMVQEMRRQFQESQSKSALLDEQLLRHAQISAEFEELCATYNDRLIGVTDQSFLQSITLS